MPYRAEEGWPRTSSTPEQRCLHPIAGPTVRADGEGGALSSDCGGLLRRGSERQLGRTARLAAASHETRHPSSRAQPLRALWAQRLSQRAAGGQAANSLRRAPLLKRGVARLPLAPAQALARAPPFSRRAPRVDRQDRSRLPEAWVAHCGASSPAPPAALGLDLDPPDAPPHGPQACAFYTHSYPHACSGPLWICAGLSGAFVTAGLRPGTRPPGTEQALPFGRRLACLRRPWPRPPLLVRGARHGAPPEVSAGLAPRHLSDVVFGLASPPVLLRHAAPVRQDARRLHQQRPALAQA